MVGTGILFGEKDANGEARIPVFFRMGSADLGKTHTKYEKPE